MDYKRLVLIKFKLNYYFRLTFAILYQLYRKFQIFRLVAFLPPSPNF